MNPKNAENSNSKKEALKEQLLDSYDLAELFNVHRNTISNWCNAGLFSFTKVGRKRIFKLNDIEKMLEEKKQTMVPGEGKKKRV